MFTTEQIVSKYTEKIAPGDKYTIVSFSGGNSEAVRFLNNLPASWKLIQIQLAESVIASPVGLFEISR